MPGDSYTIIHMTAIQQYRHQVHFFHDQCDLFWASKYLNLMAQWYFCNKVTVEDIFHTAVKFRVLCYVPKTAGDVLLVTVWKHLHASFSLWSASAFLTCRFLTRGNQKLTEASTVLQTLSLSSTLTTSIDGYSSWVLYCFTLLDRGWKRYCSFC